MTAVEQSDINTEKMLIPSRVQPPEDSNLEQFQQCWKDQDEYINSLEEKLETINKSRDERTKTEGTKREQLLIMRLTAKEQEIQEMNSQLTEMKSANSPSSALLRSTLLDPAVNLVIDKLTKQCDKLKKEVEEKDEELAAWKFTPDSASGKRLMARCRQLHQENEDLGKMIASGKLSKLESELALQKNLTETFKQNEVEMEDFIAELDEDVEGLQSTIVVLQQQLKEAKDEISKLNSELGKDSSADQSQPSLEAGKESAKTEVDTSNITADEEMAEEEEEEEVDEAILDEEDHNDEDMNEENNDDVDYNIDGDESLTESEKKREHEDSLLEEQSEPKRTKQSDTDQ